MNEYDLVDHLRWQREWSFETFGPPRGAGGVIAHLLKELAEVTEAPADLEEWMDIVILAFDGAFRMGFTPEQIARALYDKVLKNTKRTWPDWRTAVPGQPIEHVRDDS